MEWALGEKEREVRAAARCFAKNDLGQRVMAIETTGDFPCELLGRMNELGITGVITPKEHGGSELGYLARSIFLEEVAGVCAGVAMALALHHSVCAAINDHGTEAQRKMYLPPLAKGKSLGVLAVTELQTGSDIGGISTYATSSGSAFILNGRKWCITNTHLAKYWLVLARIGENKGQLVMLIVEDDFQGAFLGEKVRKIGLRGCETGQIIFDRCKVPKENVLGGMSKGFRVALGTIGEALRIGIAACALGNLKAAYEEARHFVKKRIVYGKPLQELQIIRFYLADMYADLEIARLLCYNVSRLKDLGQRCNAEAALAKYYICDCAVRAARRAVEIHGAHGVTVDSSVQRLLRDAIVMIPAGGTREVLKDLLSRAAVDGIGD